MQAENESYEMLLGSHLGLMIDRLRAIPPEKWEWTPSPAAPPARTIAEHTWNWLVADRQHLEEPNVTLHSRVPEAPSEQAMMCDALAAEKDRWRPLLLGLTPEQMSAPRYHFGTFPRDIRFIVGHIVQQVIYKSGQLSTVFFALGLDGETAYTAPFPNDEYGQIAVMKELPIYRGILEGDADAVQAALEQGDDLSKTAGAGYTPLKLAVMRNEAPIVSMLLEYGADGNETDQDGNTLLLFASFCGNNAAAGALIDHGVDLTAGNRWGATPLNCARFKNNKELEDLLIQASPDN